MLAQIKKNILSGKDHPAFIIQEERYSYAALGKKVADIQQALARHGFKRNHIALLYVYDDLETYASILAIWFSGGCFTPINPDHPTKRNEAIEAQINPAHVLSSNPDDLSIRDQCTTQINTTNLETASHDILLSKVDNQQLMYIIFTSGSTGIPKGVPIHYGNINAYIIENQKLFPDLDSNSRFLQIYDLTFDASIQSYVLPLFIGASIYTVSPKKIKYLEALRIMKDHEINFAKISNTVIHFLKPYFSKINLPSLQHCLFAGEALQQSLVNAWRLCVPNAQLTNVYGPTEATVNTHYYPIPKDINTQRSHQSVICFGKPFGQNTAVIIDSNGDIILDNKIGELCLGGSQITEGYWYDQEKNESSFIQLGADNQRFYRTGDLAYSDADGYYYFGGRIGNQVKIQGYRIELMEIEFHAHRIDPSSRHKALVIENQLGLPEVVLFCENTKKTNADIIQNLKALLPSYMMPKVVVRLTEFPHTASGKIDQMAMISSYLS